MLAYSGDSVELEQVTDVTCGNTVPDSLFARAPRASCFSSRVLDENTERQHREREMSNPKPSVENNDNDDPEQQEELFSWGREFDHDSDFKYSLLHFLNYNNGVPGDISEENLLYLLDQLKNMWLNINVTTEQQIDVTAEQLFHTDKHIAQALQLYKDGYLEVSDNIDASSLSLFGLQEGYEYSLEKLELEFQRNMFLITNLYRCFVANNLVGNFDTETMSRNRTFARIQEMLITMYDRLRSTQRIRDLSQDESIAEVPHEYSLFKFSFIDTENMSPMTQLILFFLNQAHVRGLRKYRGKCYKQIRSPLGHATHAWKEYCEISEFIHSSVSKEMHCNMWKIFTTSASRVQNVESYLDKCYDPEFQSLKPSRSIFSFTNGLYFIDEDDGDRFCPFATDPVPSNIVACRYFPILFDESVFDYDDPMDIPTPNFTKILEDQELSLEVQRVIFAFMGRLLYECGQLDDWQVLLFIKGIANSGKSTLCKIASYFYNPEDVAVMSAKIERQFGLSPIYDKYLYVCYEVREDMQLDQATFQSMVSGEPVSVAIKNKKAKTVQWTVPGIFAGNQIPAWIDASGSMSRRLLLVKFRKEIKNSDPHLMKKIQDEMSVLLYKCNKCYRNMIADYGKNNIWTKVPQYFSDTREELAAEVQPLLSFIRNSSSLKINEQYYMPIDEFKGMFIDWVKQTYPGHARKFTWNRDYYTKIFEDLGITVLRDERRDYKGKSMKVNWVMGVGPKNMHENPSFYNEGADNNDEDVLNLVS